MNWRESVISLTPMMRSSKACDLDGRAGIAAEVILGPFFRLFLVTKYLLFPSNGCGSYCVDRSLHEGSPQRVKSGILAWYSKLTIG